jgi:hypothetical protein
MANIVPAKTELDSIRESNIDFSAVGYKRFKFIDKTYKAYQRAKPKATEKEIFRWIRWMIRKLDSGIQEKDLPPITRDKESAILQEIQEAREEGRRQRVKEAIDLLSPDIRYIKWAHPDRGRELEEAFLNIVMGQNIHPATVLLRWRPELEIETGRYKKLVMEYHESQGIKENVG